MNRRFESSKAGVTCDISCIGSTAHQADTFLCIAQRYDASRDHPADGRPMELRLYVSLLLSLGMCPEQLLAFLTIFAEEVETTDLLGPSQ